MLSVNYFTDPLLQASTIGCMLLGAACGLVGTLLFLRHACLMGETLSHASYPGLVVGALLVARWPQLFAGASRLLIDAWIFSIGLLSACLGVYMHAKICLWRVHSDTALGWVLASFLGIGVLLASRLQFAAPTLYQRVQAFLYGQAATLTQAHLYVFAFLLCAIGCTFLIGYRSLLASHFDQPFAKSQNLEPALFRLWTQLLSSIIVVAGVRAGGVLIVASMLVAPATAARVVADNMALMGLWAGFFGACSGFIGNWLSVEIERVAYQRGFEEVSLLPTGPAIALASCLLALAVRLLWPGRGLLHQALTKRRLEHQLRQRLEQERAGSI